MVRRDLRRHIDDAVSTAVNDVSPELVTNWCTHIRTREVSRSYAGEMMGLPIGPKEVSCCQVEGGWQGMTYKGAAEIFISTNCPACPYHEPRGGPSVADEILRDSSGEQGKASGFAERSHELEEIARGIENADAALAADIESDEAAKELVGLISDPKRKEAASIKLALAAERCPERFSPALVEFLMGAFLDRSVGSAVMDAVTNLVKYHANRRPDLWPQSVELAILAIGRNSNTEAASRLIADGLTLGIVQPDPRLADVLVHALPAPVNRWLGRFGSETQSADDLNRTLGVAAQIDFDVMAQEVGRSLLGAETFRRAQAAAAVIALLRVEPVRTAEEFFALLIAALALPDDDDGDTDSSVTEALSQCITRVPQDLTNRALDAFRAAIPGVQTLILAALVNARTPVDDRVGLSLSLMTLVTDATLEAEVRLSLADRLQQLCAAYRSPLLPHFDHLLGAVAAVAGETDAVKASRPADDAIVTNHDFLKYESAAAVTRGVASRLAHALARVALADPKKAILDLGELLAKADSRAATSFKVLLLDSIGDIVESSDEAINPAIPIVYGQMFDPGPPGVRAAAARACAKIARRSPDGLPEDVIVAAIGLLGDQYLSPVASSAVKIFSRVKIADVLLAVDIIHRLEVIYMQCQDSLHGSVCEEIVDAIISLATQHGNILRPCVTLLFRMAQHPDYYTARHITRRLGWFVKNSAAEVQPQYIDLVISHYKRFHVGMSTGGRQYMDGQGDDDTIEVLFELDRNAVASRAAELVAFAQSASDRNGLHIASLLVAVGSGVEAASVFDAITAQLTEEPRADWRRHRYRAFSKAIRYEIALALREPDAISLIEEAGDEIALGGVPRRRLPFGIEDKDDHVDVQAEWIAIRRRMSTLPTEAGEIEPAACKLRELLDALVLRAEGRDAAILRAASALLSAAAMAGRWWVALLAADATSSTLRDAAVAHLREACVAITALGEALLAAQIEAIQDEVAVLGPSSDIDGALASILVISLPFPLGDLPMPRSLTRGRPTAGRGGEQGDLAIDDVPQAPSLAVASLRINGLEPPRVFTALANRLYDVEVELLMMNPELPIQELQFEPVSSLPSDSYIFPRGPMIVGKKGESFRLTGQMMFPNAQSDGSAPISVRITAKDEARGDHGAVELFGRREIQVLVHGDVERFRARGPAAGAAAERITRAIDAIVSAQSDPNRSDEIEVSHALANYMDYQLRNGTFRGNESEKEFESDIVQYLCMRFEERDDVYRQVFSGGGRVDILVLGVPVELKVLKDGDLDAFRTQSLPQATQYVVSQGRRVGFLAILDLRSRTQPMPALVDDVTVARGITESGLAPTEEGVLAVGTVVVRARVTRPSDLRPS